MRIGLVLGGGGARGFAHIGVLKSLLEHDLRPAAIAGCSMGGIVGALYAAGLTPDEIHTEFKNLKPHKILDFGKMGSLIGGRGIVHELAKRLPQSFEDLNVPLAVTSVDVQAGRLVVFREGDLLRALRATSAIPGIISPEKHNDRLLIDGGLLNNLPVDIIRSLTHAPVIAVDVAEPPNRKLPLETGLKDQVREVLKGGKRPLTFELFMKAFHIPTAMVTDMRLAANPPDLLVRLKLDPDFKTEDFRRLDEAVEVGYRDMEAALREESFLGQEK